MSPIGDNDARALVATLFADGTPDAVSAAAAIDYALTEQLVIAPLDHNQRDAILAALEDPSDGLAELRGALVRDFESRQP